MVMTREGLLDDKPCTDVYPFACKILGNDTKFNEICNNYDIGTLYILCSYCGVPTVKLIIIFIFLLLKSSLNCRNNLHDSGHLLSFE